MNRFVIWFAACFSAAALAQVDYQPAEAYSIDGHGRPFPGLVLSLSADKAAFKQGEEVTVTAKLTNRSNRSFLKSYKQGVFPYLISVDRQPRGGTPHRLSRENQGS